jgi:hypothetical protein
LGSVCVRFKIGQVHASIGPQRLATGSATLRALGPSSVTSITVKVYGAGGHVWAGNFRGHEVVVPLDVTSIPIWELNRQVGSTYGCMPFA